MKNIIPTEIQLQICFGLKKLYIYLSFSVMVFLEGSVSSPFMLCSEMSSMEGLASSLAGSASSLVALTSSLVSSLVSSEFKINNSVEIFPVKHLHSYFRILFHIFLSLFIPLTFHIIPFFALSFIKI